MTLLRPRLFPLVFGACAALFPVPGVCQAPSEALTPPVAKRQPHPVKIHGDTLADDYSWLRNKGTPEVEDYLNAELAYAQAFTKPTEPLHQKLYDAMRSRIQQTDTNVPYRERDFFYYSRTEEGRQYPIFCRKKGSLEAPEEVILDVNQLAQGKKFMSVAVRDLIVIFISYFVVLTEFHVFADDPDGAAHAGRRVGHHRDHDRAAVAHARGALRRSSASVGPDARPGDAAHADFVPPLPSHPGTVVGTAAR